MSKLRIAVIGAGPSGLAQLLAFKQAEEEQKIELVCFERQSDWGGLWLYNSHVGVDNHGEPIHSSMYRHLWINNPKEIMEYANYTFYDHFGCSLPSFLPRTVIYDYLSGRANAHNLRRFIRFNTAIRYVDFNDEKSEFSVDVEDLESGIQECLKFDRVIVATGRYSVPNVIKVDGVNLFPGRVLHSHDFRGGDEFVNQNVLLIGGRISAEDTALQCYKFGARSVTISSRLQLTHFKWPTGIKTAPMIIRMEGRTAHFKDGSTIDDVDAIIFCTGYRQSYSFIAKRLRLHCGVLENFPPDLYKSVFWNDQPNLAYIGTTRYLYTFNIFDIQAALVCSVFLGHIKLPDKDERQADIDAWRTREKTTIPMNIFAVANFQTAYARDTLALLSTHDPKHFALKFDYDKGDILVKNYLYTKANDIVHYRDIPYESLIDTGDKTIVKAVKPWVESMDDSMENLLSNYRK